MTSVMSTRTEASERAGAAEAVTAGAGAVRASSLAWLA